MSAEPVEERLTGGSVGGRSRIGDTVRREAGPQTAAVQGVLRHLESVGFAGSPRVLGFDERGREVLTWIDGHVSDGHPWPAELLTDAGLAAVVRLLRAFHDAVAPYDPPADSVWLSGPGGRGLGEIVCHNDAGPWNIVWRDGVPVAFIDWDFAAPANPLDDVAYVAFYGAPLLDDEHCREFGFAQPPDRAGRLRLVCETYGRGATPADLIDRAEHHQRQDLAEIEAWRAGGPLPWPGFDTHDDEDPAELLAWLKENRDQLVG